MRKRKASQPKTPLKQTKISSFFTRDASSSKRFCPGKENSPRKVESPDIIVCTPPEKCSGKARRSLLGDLDNKKQRDSKFFKKKVVDTAVTYPEEKDSGSGFNKVAVNKTEVTPTKNSELENIVDVLCTPDIIFGTPPDKSSGKSKKSLLDYFKTSSPDKINASPLIGGFNEVVQCSDSSEDKVDDSFYERPSSQLSCSEGLKAAAVDSPIAQGVVTGDLNESKDGASAGGNTHTNSDRSHSSQTFELDSAFYEGQSSEPLLEVKSGNVFENLEDFGIDDLGDWSSQKSCLEELAFDPSVLCEVISTDLVTGPKYEQLVVVKDKDSGKKGKCVLRDMWAVNINFSIGDTLTILGFYSAGNWIVDAQNGFVCLFPEILVSSTSLVGAMFCRRRGVLSNYFRGLDTDNKVMTVGSLVHDMLQRSLDINSCCADDLDSIIDELLADAKILRLLYIWNMTVQEIKKEIKFYIPFIMNFLKVYIKNEEPPTGNNFKGSITKIIDIEENVSCLKLGIKGRIDVTVNVKIHGKEKKMPLELKTGRASFSQEHKNQVFLYTLMMSNIGEKIESGLLLYLKEGILEEVRPTHVEIRDLILLRNDFAQYLRRFDVNALPEPIQFINACRRCPYSTVCSAFLSENISKQHPIRDLGIKFEDSHLAYFQKWTQILLLEDSYGTNEEDSLKLSGLTLDEGVVRLVNEHKYTFFRNEGNSTSLKTGSFVVLSAGEKTYSARIVNISPKQCSVLLERELPKNCGPYEIKGFKTSMLARYLTNLGEFMEEPHVNLREIIINKQVAKINDTFLKSVLTEDCLKILGALNEDQQRAVLKVLSAEDYILIEGPPGTGKTETIVAILKIFVSLKLSVLLVSHTHSSVDNVLLRIPEVDYLRLGNLSSLHEAVRPKSYVVMSKNAKTVTDIEALLTKPVLASTCLGLDGDIIRKIKFDVVIVDESSQVLQPEVLKPLFASKKFVLIGDPKQLRPVVRNPMAKSLGMDESIFERLYNDCCCVSLTLQYRMNKVIMGLANALTYNNKLRAGTKQVESKCLTLKSLAVEEWLKKVLSTNLEDSIVFVNIASYLTDKPGQSFSCSNPMEAKLTVKLVESLIQCGVNPESIGVMAPFCAQVKLLSELMQPGIEVNTVDQYQGRDKEVIIFSCTRMDRFQGEKGENELLNDERRFNVAVTRSKCKLIFIGDKDTLVKYQTFKNLFEYLNPDAILSLEESQLDFSWSTFCA